MCHSSNEIDNNTAVVIQTLQKFFLDNKALLEKYTEMMKKITEINLYQILQALIVLVLIAVNFFNFVQEKSMNIVCDLISAQMMSFSSNCMQTLPTVPLIDHANELREQLFSMQVAEFVQVMRVIMCTMFSN